MAALEAGKAAKNKAAGDKAAARLAAAEPARKQRPPVRAQVIATQEPPVVTTAPVQQPGVLGRVGRSLTNLFGG